MIKAEINKENPQQNVQASGNVPELMKDIAILISGIYTQFQNADPKTAKLFRMGIENMVNDPNGPVWNATGNQTGIIFKKPN